MSNFLLGGRLGDLVHALWVAKNSFGRHSIYITDRRDLHSDGFLYPLDQTIKELLPILAQQNFVGNFQEYNEEECINLSMWRRYAYSESWTKLLSNTFNIPVNGQPWLKVGKLNEWDGKIVIHSSHHEARKSHKWNLVLDKYECIFVGNEAEYKEFGFSVPFYQPKTLLEHFIIINSCKFFIGNQSAPLAIAHSLGVPRLAMLNAVDKIHYIGEERWHKDFYWISDNDYFFEGINY